MTSYKLWGAGKPNPYEVYRHRVRTFWQMKLAVRRLEMLDGNLKELEAELVRERGAHDVLSEREAGMFPFNGSWLTEGQIKAQRPILKRADRALIGDVLLLAMTLLGFSAALIVLIEFIL